MDFESEQRYMNDKRRFLNAMVTGSGIVCGLNVISLDDQSLLIESGMAIDEAGREIVVENSIVKKLSTIEGFETLKTNEICLCIKYKEEENHPVYAINRQDNEREYENNRIEEGYELFLRDISGMEEDYEPETEFYTGGVLFDGKGFKVSVRIPAYICAGQYVKLDFIVEKTTADKDVLCYEGIVQAPTLSTLDGGQELLLQVDNISLEKDEKIVQEYWLLAQTEEASDTSLMFKAGSGRATVNDIEQPIVSQLNCKLVIEEEKAFYLAARQTGSVNIELRGMKNAEEKIRLANLSIVKTGTAYLIEKVEEKSVKKYIPTLKDAWKRMEYSACFSPKMPFYGGKIQERHLSNLDPVRNNMFGNMPRLETGIVEIPIGENAKKGDICYSGEIMHGLGAGNVYVEVGYEYLEDSILQKTPTKTTVYGNPDLFVNDRTNISAETAVKVLNDKGSFVVAVKLLQNVSMLVLTYRWVAIRYDSEKIQEEIETTNNQSISALTPTVVLGTKESYYFQVKYNNMKECSISYELTEEASGEITAEGIYTAPAKEGVYEVKIYCTDKPMVCTYAYAIVKKKTVEEMQENQSV